MRAFLLAAIASALLTGCDGKPPTYAQMKEYRLSLFTDSDLRKMHADAQEEARQEYEGAKVVANRIADERAEELQKCAADVAYKARNQHTCSFTLADSIRATAAPALSHRTADQIFEAKIMGYCGNNVATAKQAKELKCMPS